MLNGEHYLITLKPPELPETPENLIKLTHDVNEIILFPKRAHLAENFENLNLCQKLCAGWEMNNIHI